VEGVCKHTRDQLQALMNDASSAAAVAAGMHNHICLAQVEKQQRMICARLLSGTCSCPAHQCCCLGAEDWPGPSPAGTWFKICSELKPQPIPSAHFILKL
jgi:hypothetical protein